MDPQTMDAETAKQASMAEEESGSPVMKKPKVEEKDKEEEGKEEEEEEEEEENDGGGDSIGDYVVPGKEPEWDVDSYDGREYKSDPEDRKFFPNEDDYQEYRLRKREIFDSKGFIPDLINGIHNFGGLDQPAGENRTNEDELAHLASLCVTKLNEDKGKSVKLVKVVRATVCGGAIWKIYITFMAQEYENGPHVEYQAKVLRYAANYKPPYPILCRPSPKQPTS